MLVKNKKLIEKIIIIIIHVFLKNNNKTLQNKFVTSPRLCNKYFLFMFFKRIIINSSRLHLKIFKLTLDICSYLYSDCFLRHT
jgi:hypothetical protein